MLVSMLLRAAMDTHIFFFWSLWLLCTLCLRIILLDVFPGFLIQACVPSAESLSFPLSCHPVSLTQFSSLSPTNPMFWQYVCSRMLMYMPQSMQDSANVCLKHLWPTEISEQYWANNNKDENTGDTQSLYPVGQVTQCFLSTNCFNISPRPLPHRGKFLQTLYLDQNKKEQPTYIFMWDYRNNR